MSSLWSEDKAAPSAHVRPPPGAPGGQGRTTRAILFVFLLIAATVWLERPAAAAADEGAVREQVEAIVKSERFQTELPNPKPTPPKKKNDGLKNLNIGDFAFYLLLGVVAAGALYILYTLAQQKIAPMRRGAVRNRAKEAPQESIAPPTAQELADAEALALAEAEAGRFDEAVHVLLLGAIGQLRERNARAAARSLTSREILSRVARSAGDEEVKAALSALVAAVEVSRFGGRLVDRAAFERCLSAYRALREAVTAGKIDSRTPRVAAAAAAT